MKWIFYVIIIIWLEDSFSIPEHCEHNATITASDCNYTDYDSYVKCIRKRVKRQTGCEEESSFSSSGSADDCTECDCNYCNENHCNSPCNTCCSPCKTRACCYRSCHAQCTTGTCRRSCKKSCTDRITATNGRVTHNVTSSQLHNITTVINVQNLINNTNIIDIPVNVNNTNINNITVGIPEPSQHVSTQKCCQIISPRQCTPYNQFPFIKCYHYRKHVCSNICQSSIMHSQPHQICDERPSGSPNCHEQTIYIPQPQPKCVSTSTWPYLVCGIKQICDGCFSEGKHCPPVCHNIGPYQRPSSWLGSSGSGFSSPGFGFSSPAEQLSAYPAYLGLPENQFSIGLPGNPEIPSSLPHQTEDLPGDPELPVSENLNPMYVINDENLLSNSIIHAEVIQPTDPTNFLGDVTYAVNIKTIKSAEPLRGDATTSAACGEWKTSLKPS